MQDVLHVEGQEAEGLAYYVLTDLCTADTARDHVLAAITRTCARPLKTDEG
ncbi:hypothetical protein [Actinomadura pelletieri]|uniref:hypothetical protein n=1 Tax=Actinomadura pelletieri TaxID=111805 RepID=UPI001476BBEF|nr:hypothetical protein [Actinomadura pelletieri]